MTRKSFSSLLKTCLERIRFKSQKMEASYYQFQKEVEQNLLNFTNILSMLLMVGICISNLIFGASAFALGYRFGVFFLCLIGYLCRNKWPMVQRFIIIFFCGSALYVVIIAFPGYFSKMSAEGAFIGGNMTGLMEMTIVLSFKSMKFRGFTYAVLLIAKGISLREELYNNPGPSSFIFLVTLMVIAFYVYKDVLDRREFRMVYESREKLRKFEDLLSNGFPSSVVVISVDLKSIFYANSLFREKFIGSLGQENNQHQNYVRQIFEKFILQLNSANSESFADFLKNLAHNNEGIQKQQNQEREIVTVLTLYKNEQDDKFYYEIKLRKVIWEEQHSYAIILNDVSDKQLVIGLKMADEQKDRVIATVSHELRTPINGIIGLLEMITMRVKDDEKSQNYLDHCKSCSKLLLYLVNSILDLSQIRNNSLTLNREWINLPSMLEEVRSLYIFHSQQKGISFIIEKEPEVPEEIFTDKYRLIQVLINLLGNAMKFTFKGSILLKISNDFNGKRDKIIFSVQDTGIGIQKEDQSKLFRMYGKIEQANRNINSHGVGLGLTISNELVKLLNGNSKEEKINVDSEYGRGSKFWFKIDIGSLGDNIIDTVDFDVEESQNSSDWMEMKIKPYTSSLLLCSSKNKRSFYQKEIERTTSASQNNKSKLVLLVDDNPFNLMAAAFIMEKIGYATHQAFNGRECIDMLEKSVQTGKYYSLILTDIQMPVLDGLEMSKEIKAKINSKEIYNVPIIAVTAQAISEEEKIKYCDYGISFVIQKPVVPEVIQRKIEALII